MCKKKKARLFVRGGDACVVVSVGIRKRNSHPFLPEVFQNGSRITHVWLPPSKTKKKNVGIGWRKRELGVAGTKGFS
jgi:hypothetical protein